jgi:hypothetical protein
MMSKLLLIPKILDLKAIHNYLEFLPPFLRVVTDPKDIGFESNSQHGRNGTLYPVRCY